MHRARTDERGQASVLLALVAVFGLAMAIGFALVGGVLLERQGATVAADAIALASVGGDSSGQVEDWYRRHGVDTSAGSGRADTSIGAGRASSRAERDDTLTVAPAVVAILERAEQLLGVDLEPLDLEGVTVSFAGPAAGPFSTVAADLGMCEIGTNVEVRQFMLC